MAVESRFVVIRHGVEVQTFMDKKAADDYDKMLDMADNLTSMLNDTPFEMSDELKENLSIYLAQNREDVLVALQAKKAKPVTTTKTAPSKPLLEKEDTKEVNLETANIEEVTLEKLSTDKLSTDKAPVKKAVTKKKTKNTENETED